MTSTTLPPPAPAPSAAVPVPQDRPSRAVDPDSFGEQLRRDTVALRLKFRWLGTRRSLSADQKLEVAEPFEACSEFVSAGKKLLDTSHPAFLAVTRVRRQAISYWRSRSVPYPEPGIRLVRAAHVPQVLEQLERYRDQLHSAVRELERVFDELRDDARQRLGRLFNEADYPRELGSGFAMGWDFPSVEPPEYLAQLSPRLYQQECQRVARRFDQAVELAETAFLEEFAQLVSHLCERLSGEQDGRPKVFRDSAVENLHEFFGRFQSLDIGSSRQLQTLIEQAQQAIAGNSPRQLRTNGQLRRELAAELGAVQHQLQQLAVEQPRRSLLRRPR